MSWAGVLFLGALGAMVGVAFLLMMSSSLGSGEVPLAGLVTIGGMLAAIGAAGFAARKPFWLRIHRVDIAADGTWTLRNPLGLVRAVLPPAQERMVHARPYTMTQWDANSFVQIIERAEITFTLPDNRSWIGHTNHFPGCLASLGYDIAPGTDLQEIEPRHFAVGPHDWRDGAVHWV